MLVQSKTGSDLIRETIAGLMEAKVSKVNFEKWIEFRYGEDGIIIIVTPIY